MIRHSVGDLKQAVDKVTNSSNPVPEADQYPTSSADNQELLNVSNLSVVFTNGGREVKAVDQISFNLNRGETLAILGESGSGKSVTASTIMGILDSPPGHVRSGTIHFNGQELIQMPSSQRRLIMGRNMAIIFQDTLAHLNPVYSVGWQIAENFRIHQNMGKKDAMSKAVGLLEQVQIPDAARRARDYPHQFSGGQRQRVMIAMALAMEPDVLIADEPTTALDVTVQSRILDLLLNLRNELDMGLILITHDLGVAAEIADRILVMNNGRVVEHGSVEHIFTNPQHPYTRKLLKALPGLHESSTPAVVATEADTKPLLQVSNLTKSFNTEERGFFPSKVADSVIACNNLSFDLFKGETLGIVGESGSGKTTLANLLLKLVEPDSGTAFFGGQDIFNVRGEQLLELRRRFQVIFQDPFASLNPRMKVEEIIAEPWVIHKGVLPKSQHQNRVCELLESVGLLPEHARRYPHQFSGGQRQRIAVARAIALEPEIIICDEAVSALDVSIQAQIIALLADLRDRLGLSYLFIAHDLPVVKQIADRVLVMQSGNIVEQGTVDQIFNNPAMEYTRELLAANPVPDPLLMKQRRARRGVGV